MVYYDLNPKLILFQGDVIKESLVSFLPENASILRKPPDPAYHRYENPPAPPVDLVGIYNPDVVIDAFHSGSSKVNKYGSGRYTVPQSEHFKPSYLSGSFSHISREQLQIAYSFISPIIIIGYIES